MRFFIVFIKKQDSSDVFSKESLFFYRNRRSALFLHPFFYWRVTLLFPILKKLSPRVKTALHSSFGNAKDPMDLPYGIPFHVIKKKYDADLFRQRGKHFVDLHALAGVIVTFYIGKASPASTNRFRSRKVL